MIHVDIGHMLESAESEIFSKPHDLRNEGREQADFHSARLCRGIICAWSELRLQPVTDKL